jgi:hypothetical protein
MAQTKGVANAGVANLSERRQRRADLFKSFTRDLESKHKGSIASPFRRVAHLAKVRPSRGLARDAHHRPAYPAERSLRKFSTDATTFPPQVKPPPTESKVTQPPPARIVPPASVEPTPAPIASSADEEPAVSTPPKVKPSANVEDSKPAALSGVAAARAFFKDSEARSSQPPPSPTRMRSPSVALNAAPFYAASISPPTSPRRWSRNTPAVDTVDGQATTSASIPLSRFAVPPTAFPPAPPTGVADHVTGSAVVSRPSAPRSLRRFRVGSPSRYPPTCSSTSSSNNNNSREGVCETDRVASPQAQLTRFGVGRMDIFPPFPQRHQSVEAPAHDVQPPLDRQASAVVGQLRRFVVSDVGLLPPFADGEDNEMVGEDDDHDAIGTPRSSVWNNDSSEGSDDDNDDSSSADDSDNKDDDADDDDDDGDDDHDNEDDDDDDDDGDEVVVDDDDDDDNDSENESDDCDSSHVDEEDNEDSEDRGESDSEDASQTRSQLMPSGTQLRAFQAPRDVFP